MADAENIARPYAEAIFNMARDNSALKEWEQRLELMANIAKDEAMQRFLGDPRASQEQKEAVFQEVAGDALGEEGQRALDVLFENDRVSVLPHVLEQYRQLRQEAEGEVHAVVTTAADLSDDQKSALTDKLEKRFGKKVTVETRIDENLLGGMVVRAGDQVIDGSIRGGLDQLRNQLKA